MTPATVPEVVERLRAIETEAPRSDGVACFARLYREVTQAVDVDLGRQSFRDAAFMQELDVRFAGLFFEALGAYERAPGTTPPAWRPLFEQRARRGIAPLQFAVAGMNAHINRDLPVALVTTCRARGLELAERSPEHGDFEHVNALLAHVEGKIKHSYVTGWLGRLDRLLHRAGHVDDVVAMWDVSRARDAAWTNARVLWMLQGEIAADFLASLDRMVGLASRGLLRPPVSVLGRVTA